MNVAGPSRPRLVPGPRERDNYEEDLTRMIAQLELSDVERLQTLYHNRVHRGEGLTDREVAFALLMQNARELAEFNADRALAQQLQEGDGEPVPAPMPATVALQRAAAPQPTIRNTTSKTQTWGQWFAAIFSAPVSNGQTPPNPAQAPTIVRPAPPRATGHDCVICQDPIFGAEVRAPCGHFYDIGCITDLFQSATRDESLYPPRCCRQNITLPQVRPHLTQAVLAEFELKAQEFGTMKRVYCVAPTCSRFLGPLYEGFFNKVFTCTSPTCTTTTCGKCRGRYEGFTHSCTPDADAEQVLMLSRASGWARCPGCAQMIELNMGCFHMTCRCRTEFCYLCKVLWKNCRCPQWDEARLLAAAERRVDAQMPAAPVHRAQPANPPRQVPAVRQPVPAAGAVRIQHANLPRPAPVPALRPVPVANIRPANPPQQVPVPAPRAAPVVNTRPTARRAEVPAPTPIPVPPRPTTLRPEAPAPAPLPAPPSLPGTRRAEVNAHVPEWQATWRQRVLQAQLAAAPDSDRDAEVNVHVPEWRATWHQRVPQAQPAAAPDSDRNTVRQRMIMETMERLRVDHDCDHTNWKFRRGGGRCESCEIHLPLYLFRCKGCDILACNRCRRNRL
ncbi:hypothetical protein DEU56DRAFT_323867 [Suillus clintonianus]|uniref:uncharacterized protein n=1 Tax=Suillus clintonianus TaxID=1904413 RepID=UPI001B87F49A|nr:uncharacterized protein DEU56DRAFT_323867 [Suillus clintonianus]KAG2139232.1 hypothetical protein DEU56DRAFT_323867 [Suillus clintonianus]